jgi:cytochrome c heme-lyase
MLAQAKATAAASASTASPASPASPAAAAAAAVSEPAKGAAKGKADVPEVYDVYGNRIDPTNMMPASPNQLPVAGQDAPLPQERVQSSIPKGGTESTWVYPSPQQFYNSLVRKQKSDNVSAKEVELIVAIHNNMNEHGWNEVRRWESMHASECAQPKLLKFQGKPHDLSPLARVRLLLGYGKPFDRHDWTVDRCGTRVRYILDYYHAEDPTKLRKFGVPSGAEGNNSQLVLDVRPAYDSVGAAVDRARVSFARIFGLASIRIGGFSSPPDVNESLARNQPKVAPPQRLRVTDEEEFKLLSSLTAPMLNTLNQRFEGECSRQLVAVQTALTKGDEAEQHKANIALRLCMANIVCPKQAAGFRRALDDRKADADQAFELMDACVERFAMAAARELANEAIRANNKKEVECNSADAK